MPREIITEKDRREITETFLKLPRPVALYRLGQIIKDYGERHDIRCVWYLKIREFVKQGRID